MPSNPPEPHQPASSVLNGRYVHTACVSSIIVVAIAIVALAPTSSNQSRFNPRIVARLGDVDDRFDYATVTSCCGCSHCPARNDEHVELFSPIEHRDPLRDIEPILGK